MPQYELIYFPAKGKANMIRLLLADQAVPYKYTAVAVANWPAAKAGFPFGQVPVLIVNGDTTIAQSHTIARFLAREHGLLGSGSLEQAQVEMWVDQTLDIRTKFFAMLYTNYEAGLQPFLDSLASLLAPFESRLAAQPDGSKHLALGRQTLADYALFDLLFFLQALRPDCVGHAAAGLKAFYDHFADRPAIRAYMQSEEFKNLRTTGSPHLP